MIDSGAKPSGSGRSTSSSTAGLGDLSVPALERMRQGLEASTDSLRQATENIVPKRPSASVKSYVAEARAQASQPPEPEGMLDRVREFIGVQDDPKPVTRPVERKAERSSDASSTPKEAQTEGAQDYKSMKNRAIDIAKRLWDLWDKPCNVLPTPWNKVAKFGLPVLASTVGVIWFSAVVEVGVAAIQLFGDKIEPLLGVAAFLGPMFGANKILSKIEKALKIEPIEGWKRQALLLPVQAGLLVGATIWTLSIGLSPVTYAVWAASLVGTGYLASKLLPSLKATTWAAVGTALVLPWSHLLTQRTYDVTVLDASPDPELAAWNVTTDLMKGDHWKKILFFKDAPPPSGKSGMVFLNRDVPLYFPPHREANEYHGAFVNMKGQKVRVTTIGAWIKPLSDKLQPTIVKYELLSDSPAAASSPSAQVPAPSLPAAK